MYKKFDEFLDRQRVQSGLPTMDLEERKNQWLADLDRLYRTIDSFLRPYIQDHRLVALSFHSAITEEQLGKYNVETMRIGLQGDGNAQAELVPVGTFVIGARGRVDLVGPTGKTVKLLLVNKNETRAGAKRQVFPANLHDGATREAEGQAEWAWKIATPPPDLEYIEMNESSFLEALMYVLER